MPEKHEHRKPSPIRTYQQLKGLAKNFATDPKAHSLIVFGTPGLAKSQTFERTLKNEPVQFVSGRLSAYNLFHKIETFRDQLFVFDDTRSILKDNECVNLLMRLGEDRARKIVQYNTGKESLICETASRQVILINRIQSGADIEPIVSRSNLYRFEPSKEEVHEYVGTWFPKTPARKEIYNFIGAHLDLIPVADIRDYTKTESEMWMDWRNNLIESWTSETFAVAAIKVRNNRNLRTKVQKATEFKRLCGGSVSQLYWWLDKLSK